MTLGFTIFTGTSQRLPLSSTATDQQSLWKVCGRSHFPFFATGQVPKWGNVELADLLCVSRPVLDF